MRVLTILILALTAACGDVNVGTPEDETSTGTETAVESQKPARPAKATEPADCTTTGSKSEVDPEDLPAEDPMGFIEIIRYDDPVPECDDQGHVIYLAAADLYEVCHGDNWVPLNLSRTHGR